MATGSRLPRRPFLGRRVLLGVTGGIAAYKALHVARDLSLAGAAVDVVLTRGALEFLQPLSFEALTGRAAHTTMYAPGDPSLHIRLAREADLVVVAPATANFMASAAQGDADELLTVILLATRAPVLLCPAMNDRMYAHPQTQANLQRLREIGYRLVGPATGPLAWSEGEGPGRLVEPEVVVAHAARALEGDGALAGRRVVVTAGPTREPLDPVRFLGNRSSGRMGYALAETAWERGADVTLVSGPSALPEPHGVRSVRIETAHELLAAVSDALPTADVLVMAAAVADFGVRDPAAQKIKKASGAVPTIELVRNPDVLLETRSLRPAGCITVGFALETESPTAHGRTKLETKGLDLLVVNDATEPGAGFEVATNRVTILDAGGGEEALPLLSKHETAQRILDRVASLLPPARGA